MNLFDPCWTNPCPYNRMTAQKQLFLPVFSVPDSQSYIGAGTLRVTSYQM